MSTVIPPNLSLLPNQFYWETSVAPGRIWVGVPTSEDPTGRKMILDTSVVGAGFPEAPINGTTFGRKDGGWNAVLPLTGGTLSGALTIASVAAPTLNINATALGAGPLIALNNVQSPNLPGGLVRASRNNSPRWDAQFGSPDSESTGNAGSYFQLIPYSDAGVSLGVMFRLTRLGSGFFDGSSFAFGQAPRNSLFIAPGAGAANPIILTQSRTGGLVLPVLAVTPTTAPLIISPIADVAQVSSLPWPVNTTLALGKQNNNRIVAFTVGGSPIVTFYTGEGNLVGVGLLPTSAGRSLLTLEAGGYDGAAWKPTAAKLQFVSPAQWNTASTPAYLAFLTTAIGSITATERMRLTDAGTLQLTSAPTTISPITPGTLLHLAGADSTIARALIDGVGVAAVPTLTGRRAMGTNAARTALALDEVMLALHGRGYGATGFGANPRAGIEMRAAENWSDASQGTYLSFLTGTTGTNGAMVEAMRITADRTVLIGKSASLGLVNLEVVGGAIFDTAQVGSGANNALTMTPGAVSTNPVTLAQSGTGGLILPPLAVTLLTAPLVLNTNNSPLPAQYFGGTAAVIVSASGNTRFMIDAYGGGGPAFTGRVNGGSTTVPAPVALDATLIALNGVGFGSTVYAASTRAAISLRAAQTWSDIAHGTYIRFDTTPIGTINNVERLRVTDQGALQFAVTGPSISVGNGAPATVQPAGSLYMRRDGGPGTRIYVNQDGAGTWLPIPNV